jgi:integrase
MGDRVNFTAQRIAGYQCDKGKDQSFLWDTKSPCLALRATRNGAKSYVCQAKLHGKAIRITMGSPDVWKIPDAREEANRFKVLIDRGLDPRSLKAEVKAADDAATAEKSARKLIARTAWNAYMKAPHPKWGATHRQDHVIAAQEGGEVPKIGTALTRPGPLASLLSKPLHAITAEVVSQWLADECKTRPTAAKNSLRKFRAFVSWCTVHPTYKAIVHADCTTATIVKDITPSNKSKPNDSLQSEQLALWFKHVLTISNPVMSAYLQGLLLTGARRTEWQLLKWADVDFRWKKMTIRDKVEETRTIPLTPYLASVLQKLPRVNEYVFSSPGSKEGHVVGVFKPHVEAVERAGLPQVSLHGLRRSFATLSEWSEPPAGVVAQIMGHKPSAIAERHYIQREIEFLRMHHERIEAWILHKAKVKIAAKPKAKAKTK